jgi:hypothetical protein
LWFSGWNAHPTGGCHAELLTVLQELFFGRGSHPRRWMCFRGASRRDQNQTFGFQQCVEFTELSPKAAQSREYSRVLLNKEGGYAPNYTPMCVNEMVNGFIIDGDVLVGKVEHPSLITSVDTINSQYDADIAAMFGDTTYSAGENLTAMEARNVELLSPLAGVTCENNPAIRDDPTQPVADEDIAKLPKNASSKVFDRQAFVYDEEQDCYHCPEGRTLNRRGTETQQRAGGPVLSILYECEDCSHCSMASECRQKVDSLRPRRVIRDVHESARERHRERMQDATVKERYKQRQHFGETPFAALKTCFDLRRFSLRGLKGVQTEFQWACSAFNTKKLMTLLAALRAGGRSLDERFESCGT